MNPLEKFLLFVAAPAVLVFALIEAVVLSRRQRYDWRAFGVSAFDLVVRIAVGILLPLSIATPLVRWAYHHRLTTVPLVEERNDLPCRYGLVHPLVSYNPLKVEFAQWLSLARDLAGARSLRAAFGHLFMPPGWAPHGAGNTTAELRARQRQN